MIMKANKQIGFIYKDNESIDRILKDGEVVFERGFLREKTSTTLPITFGGVGKDLKDYRVYGNTYQNSTSGKNLFDKDTTNVLNAYFDSSHINITADTTNKVIYLPCKPSTTYSITQGASSLSNHLLQIGTTNTKPEIGTTTYSFEDHRNDLTFTYITNSTAKYIIIRLRNGDYTDSTYMSTVQLEEGSSATSYEPYTGGQPSPNPDYPQKIISCGDRAKNLFDGEYEVGGYDISTGEKAVNTYQYRNKNFIEVKPNTSYIFSLNEIKITETPRYYYYDKNKNFLSSEVVNGNFVTPNNCYFVNWNSSALKTNYPDGLTKPMIEEGSTATSYEPYGYKIPVNVRSENLFDVNTITPNTYITNVGATGSSQSTHLVDYIPVYKDKPIIVSYDYDTLVTTANRSLVFYDTNKNYISGQYYSPIPKIHQFIPEQDGYIRFAYDKNCTNIYISYYNETANIYLDEPLRKIDGYSDFIDFINGKVVRNISEYKITGSEDFANSFGTNLFDAQNLFNDKPFITNYGLCNMYRYNSIQSGINNNTINGEFVLQKVYYAATGLKKYNLFIKNTFYNDSDAFKTYLQDLYNSGTPVIINYPLETSTEESITLPNIPTIDGNNTLNIETEITPSQVYIKYKSNE